MPGRKHRTIRRKKRKPPTRRVTAPSTSTTLAVSSTPSVVASTSTTSSTLASTKITACEKKLRKSPYLPVVEYNSDNEEQIDLDDFENWESLNGDGVRLLEVKGLQTALLESVLCKKCGCGPVEFQEEIHRKQGLMTYPFLHCGSCHSKTYIPFATVGSTKKFAINQKSVFANKCTGGTHSSLTLLYSMQDLPLPVSPSVYAEHARAVCEKSILQAEASMKRARQEVRQHYNDSTKPGDIADILISCDGTWQKRGFTSLYGAVFVIAHETGKVMDFAVMSKYCAGCRKWEGKDQTSKEYLEWKEDHIECCTANYAGSSGGMEPHGTMKMFNRSLDEKIRYKYLISDGDSKSHTHPSTAAIWVILCG